MEDNIYFGSTYEMDNLLWNFNSFFSITLGLTFFRYCGTNWLWFLFKQPLIKALNLIFNYAYISWKKKDRDKNRYHRAQIFFLALFFSFSFFCFLISSNILFRFSISVSFYFNVLNLIRAYLGWLVKVNIG